MGDIYYSVGGNEQEQRNKQFTGNYNSDQYLNSLNEEERKKIMAEGQQPLTGREAALALKQDPDLVLTKQEYQSYLDYHKTEESHILEGISEGASAVLGDIVKAGGAFLDHPLTATAKLTPSLIEAFSQGTRNLYGMMAQSGDPNSILFKMKDAIAGNGSDAGYQQFLEARKFLKESGQLATGEKTLVVDKDLIDHDVTQAMSYIADPTLFIPFGAVASAGIRAVGMGEKLAALSMRAGAIKAAVIGGGLKYAVGAPIEFMGGAVRGTIDRAAAIGGGVLETATGMSAADLKGTLRLSGVATTGASIAGHGVPIVSDISNLYMAGGAARGIGEAIGLVGNQMMNQGLKRGNLSFAAQAIIDTERAGIMLSKQTKGLLKVIDTFDPLLAYGVTMGEGMAHGAVIGGGLGYLSGGEEGMGHGIGAGMALGGVGAGMGRIFADVTGGIRLARAEVQGHFNLVTDKEFNPARYEQFSLELANAKSPAHRATILQTYGGLDIIAPKAEWHMGQLADFEAGLKAKGFDPEGYIIDPSTGLRQLDGQGNPIKGHGIGSKVFRQIEGGVIINKDGVVSIHINRDNASSTTMSHEIFHAVLKTTVMRDGFLRDWTSSLLGRFDANGVRVENGKVDSSEFKQFTDRYYDDMPALENETAIEHKQRIVDMKKGLTEAHDSYIKNNGDLSKMTETERNTLLYQTEEFGAYYFEKWIAGKPLDYLFHGGKIPGIRGLISNATDSLSDYWLRKGGKANPAFDFTKTKPDGTLMPIESTFQPAGKGSRTRNPAFDALMSDFIKAHSANQQARALALGEWTATGRLAYMRGNGLDGLNALFDPITGLKRTVTAEQIDAENKKKGAAIADSLIKMPPADRTSVTDGDGNITGTFSDKELVVLVKEGHISQPMADRIKNIQECIVDKTKPNIFGFLYHGNTKETAVVGSSQPRLTGDAVPVTRRRVVPVGHTISFGKDGFSVVMHGLDMNVIDARGNNLWADPKVRALWGDNRVDFDASFAEYISNASKASNDTTRVPSEMLPSLAQLDGNGAERRNIMHQFLGLAKAEGVAFQNKPIAEIPRGTTSSMTSFRMDLMSPFTVDHMAQRMNFDLGNAFKDLSTNFKVSEMAKEDTPNGVMWTHESGYKLSKDSTTGKVQAYDSTGKHLGVFDSTKKAEFAAKTAYAKEQADIPNRQIRGAKIQQDFQNQFKVFHDTDRAQAFERGDVFETDTARALTDGTHIIRQTREEHYNERFLKLRQSDPETVLQAAEAVVAKGEIINQKITELEKVKSTVRGKELVAVIDQIKRLQSLNRTYDIKLAIDRAKSAFTDRASQGEAMLEYIKSSRKNGVRYDEMAKTFFGESYDSQFQTGKPTSVVATHGTNSAELLASREFNPEKFGVAGRHGSAEDSVGAFFSGEIKTSRGYGLDTNKSGIELREKYGHETVHRQVRTINRYDNPLVVDGEFQNYSPSRYRAYIEAAKAGGHDGIIIKNIYDGGYADTVFVTMADKVKDNTMIIDTRLEVGDLRGQADAKWSYGEHTEGAYSGDIQQSVPRGAMTMLDMGGSWKVGDKNETSKPLTNSEKQALKIVRTTLPMSMPAIWDMLKKSGDIVKNFDWRQIKGAVIVSNPDTMIAGSVNMGKTPILKEVKGGPNFLIAQQGEAWAVASKAKQTEYVNALNAAYDAKVNEVKILGEKQGWSADKLKQELANVSVHMVLTRGSDAKVLNNTQGAFGAMTLLKDFVKKGVLTEQGLRDALDKASKHTYKDGDTGVITRTFPTLDYTGTENVKLNKLLSDKFFDSKDTSTFDTRGTFVGEVLGEIAKNNKEFKSKENLAKLKEVFSNPEFKLSKEALLSEIGKSFSEPYTDNIPQHHAFASVEINGRVEGAPSAHPAYPHGIRKVGGGQVKLNLFSDTVAIRDMVNHPTAGDLSKTPLAENKLGSNSKGIARAVMKSSSEHSARPEGEGRIGANYKVGDFHSPLEKTVEGIFERTVGKDQSINPARLLNLLKSASGGNVGKILTEANANGLTKFLESRGQKKMPIQEIRDYLNENGIKVTMNKNSLGVDADFGNTQAYISQPWNPSGNKEDNYHTILLNIDPKNAHGVAGHFDQHSPTGTTGDTIGHIRGTVRKDAQGRKVFNVEEMQVQNSNAGVLTSAQKTKAIDMSNRLNEILNKQDARVLKENIKAKGLVTAHDSFMDSLSYTPTLADDIDWHLKRIDSWFDQTRSGTPDATPALQAEMMAVVDKGIQNYNRSLSSEAVPTGAVSPADLFGKLRMYDPKKDAWIPTYYRKAMHDGFSQWAMIVDRVSAGKATANDAHLYPELVKSVNAKKALQKGISDRTKAELQAQFTREEMPAAYENGLINPDYAKMKKSELEYSLKKVANDKPLQDFSETTRLMHRATMAKAVALGVDRVTFVQSKDTHAGVQMRNERGAQLYDKDIPAIVNGELKKFGTKLKSADNIDQSPSYPSSDMHNEHTMLSGNLGYDITPQMADAVSESQPHYKVSDIAGEPRDGGRTYDTSSEQWKRGFIGRIAEQNPEKYAGLEINYIENKRLIKGRNLVTLALHNKEGQQVGLINATVYEDGVATIVDTQVAKQFGNKGYSKLMLSELGERIRSQGVTEVIGEVVDRLDRPTKARRSVWGNAELEPNSVSNISESGKLTVSKLNPEARYKVSDAGIARVQEKVDYLKGLMDRYEKFKDAKGRGNSDNKRKYWDAKREHNSLVDYTLKPMLAEKQKETNPDIKPFEGNFKVSKAVHNSVGKVADVIASEKDKSNLSPSIKSGFKAFSDAVKMQDSTDEVLMPEVRTAYDALRKRVKYEIDNSASGFTPKKVLENIKTQLDKVDKHISKDAKKIAEAIHNRDMAEGADVEGRQSQSARAENQRDMAEGADIEAEGIQATRAENQRTLDEGADVEAENIKKVRSQSQATHRRDMAEGTAIESEQAIQDRANNRSDMEEGANMDREQFLQRDLTEGEQLDAAEVPRPSVRTAPARPSVPFNLDASLLGSPANPVMPPLRLPSAPVPTGLPLPSRHTAPVPAPARPNPNATPATPTTQAQSGVPNRAWRGWVYDKSPNGSIYSNGIGWMIMVQGDKFKVYNPQRAMLGIYTDLEQAKRRVQREEPKR